MNYQHTMEICLQTNRLSGTAIDDFLIYYAARHDKIDQEAAKQLEKYRHITRQQDPAWVNYMKTQYIAHRIFKKNGLINKYLHHSVLKELDASEIDYLRQQAAKPWRFCFSKITGIPAEDFYEMEDILNGEAFLLYSPGTTDILRRGNKTLWFNLIAFNGVCWQTFGTINGYSSFYADDIFFYATEMDPALESKADIIAHIESNPVPYMMLLSGSELPVIVNGNEQIIFTQAEYDLQLPAAENLKKDFKIQTAGNVTQYSPKRWDSFPHYAQFYYDSQKKLLRLKAMTNKGFAKLTEKMNAAGIPVSPEPDMSVTPTMLNTAEKILKKKIMLDEYVSLFEEEENPTDKEGVDKLNALVQLIVPYLNAGKEPDISMLARKTGYDAFTIKDVIAQMRQTIDRMKR
ncbi:MAG: hypothetical protein QM763_23455 [Agriterribacter sp.]